MTEGASSPVQSTTTGTIGALDAAGTTALASIRAQEEKKRLRHYQVNTKIRQ